MDSRNNIMFRKSKQYMGRNDCSADSQYAAEQARLEALRRRREDLVEAKRVATCGSTEEQHSLKSQIYHEGQYQQNIRDEKVRGDRDREREDELKMERHRQMMEEMELEREMERRAKLRQIQEENRLAAMGKNYDQVYQKIQGDQQDRSTVEKNLYNYNSNVL